MRLKWCLTWIGQWADRVAGNTFLSAAFILSVALAVRLAYLTLVVGLGSSPTYDGISYDIFAVQLARGEGYHTAHGPTAFKPPLYPLFLSGIYLLLGTSNYVAIGLVQAIVDSFSALVIYALGRRMFDYTTGILAGLGTALYPLCIYMTGELYPETLFFFLFSLLLCRAYVLSTSRSSGADWRGAMLCGTLLGLSVLSRPSAVTSLPALVIWPFLNLTPKVAARRVALMMAITCLVLAPWVVRNYLVFHEFIPLTTESGVVFWQGNNPLSRGGGTEANESTWPTPDYPDLGFYGWSNLTERQSDRKFFVEGWRWVRENPLSFISLIPRKIVRLWSPISFTTQSSRTAPPGISLILLPYSLFLLVVLYGALSVRRRWREAFVLYAMPVLTSLNAAMFFGGTRYSIPMVSALVIFAAVGAEDLMRRLSIWRNDRVNRNV